MSAYNNTHTAACVTPAYVHCSDGSLRICLYVMQFVRQFVIPAIIVFVTRRDARMVDESFDPWQGIVAVDDERTDCPGTANLRTCWPVFWREICSERLSSSYSNTGQRAAYRQNPLRLHACLSVDDATSVHFNCWWKTRRTRRLWDDIYETENRRVNDIRTCVSGGGGYELLQQANKVFPTHHVDVFRAVPYTSRIDCRN